MGFALHRRANLEKNGFLEAIEVTRQGARPERTVYQITDAGRDELVAWTRELIAEPAAEHTRFVAGLSVLAALSPQRRRSICCAGGWSG